MKGDCVAFGDMRGSGRRAMALARAAGSAPLFEAMEDRRLLATFTVTNLNNSGAGSLRDAVASANAAPGADVINFQAGVIGTITLTTGQLTVADDLAINGPGADRLTVANGSGSSRVFSFQNGTCSLSGLSVTGGSLPAGPAAGAGIYNAGTLLLGDMAIASNTAGGNGGGVYNDGVLTIAGSTITANSAALGGGVYNAATLTVVNSTISQSQAIGGGGIYSTGTLTVRNSTIAGNAGGRGINIAGGTGQVVSTVISGNTGGDVSGTFAAGSTNNLVKDAVNTGGLTNGVNGNLVGADPLLVNLATNGGATRTMALSAGSPAIGKGINPAALTTDQRGGPFTRGTAVDIGAYQRQTLALVVDTSVDEQDWNYGAGDLSLREAIAAAGPNPGNDTITFASTVSILTLGGSELLVAGDLTINGPGLDRLEIRGNNVSRVFRFSTGTSAISGVAIRFGNTVGSGGGIYNAGTLTISGVLVDSNASGGSGGGVYNIGTLVVSGSVISSNNAAAEGGGVASTGPLTINYSAVVSNVGSDGGGVWGSSTFGLSNSTVALNQGTDGGGIFAQGATTLTNSTIASNTGRGLVFSGSCTARSTIVAGNIDGDVFGLFAAGSTNNLVQDSTADGGLTNGVNGNLVGVDPLLSAPASNGGRSKTMELAVGSPAIGKGINPNNLTTDQRGGLFARGTAVDIGAYQRQVFNLVVDTLGDNDDGNYTTGNLSLREALGAAGPNPGDDTVSFAPALNNGTIKLGGTRITVSGSVIITGPGANLLTVSGDRRSPVLFFASGTSSISGLSITNGGGALSSSAGIANNANLTMTNMVIAGNSAYFSGGGVGNFGTLSMIGCTISNNDAGTYGGGVYNGSLGVLTITSSTITANSASSGEGGGVRNLLGGTVTIQSSTVAGNSGGGIKIDVDGVTLGDVIVSGNSGGDVLGTLSPGSTNNLIKDAGTAGGLTNNVAGNIVGLDPLLGPLAFNGGPTRTMALLTGSPAISKGSNPAGLSVDQRGAGFPRARGAATDIGAIEFAAAPAIVSLTLSTPSITRGQSVTLTANNVTDADGPILNVLFYYDANSNGVVDVGEVQIGADSNSAGGYSFVFTNTSILAGGTVRLLAVGKDTENQLGVPVGANLTVTNAAPVLGSFSAPATAVQGDSLGFGASGTDDGTIASVSFYRDINANGAPDAGELLATSDGNGGFNVTLNAAQTDALPLGVVQLLARATDTDGVVSNVLSRSMTVVFGVRAGTDRVVAGTADASDASRVVTVNSNGHVIVFEAGWSVTDLQAKTGAPSATGDAVIWLDPKDGKIYVAAPSAQGTLLFSGSDGTWTFRNLTTETGASASPTHGLAQISSINNIIVLAGITADGKIVGFQQTLVNNQSGQPEFRFIDISGDLASQGMVTPQLSSLIGYVTTWDAWNLAGIDSNGKLQVVWVVPATFTTWRTDDLSAITGAPAAQGQLAITLTSWGGINLSGLSAGGSLMTTWWVPSFGGVWQVNDLTAQFNGAPLSGGKVSGFTTPWGGLNYVGLANDGTVMVYWWVPGLTDWNVSPLLPDTVPSDQRPTGTLTSSSSASGTLNVYGSSATGEALRMWWNPSGAATWTVENVSTLAGRI